MKTQGQRSTVNGMLPMVAFILCFVLCDLSLSQAPDGSWGIAKRNGAAWDMKAVAPGTLGTVKFFAQDAGGNLILTAAGSGGGDAVTTDPLSQFATTTSLQLKGVLSDETGSGAAVFANTPTFITPILGAATATSINGLTITSSTGTLTITNLKTLTVSNTITLAGTDGSTLNIGAGGTLGTAAFTAATAYVPIASLTGGGVLATGGFTLTVPATGTAQLIGGVLALDGFSSVTGTLANARLAAALSGKTYEGLTITTTSGGTLTIANSKTLTVSDNITLASDGTGTRTLNVGAGGTLGTGAFQPQTVLTGTANQISVTNSGVGATTLSTPQNIGTGSTPQFAGIELGHASDTTISRTSAGVANVEGVDILTTSGTASPTNKTFDASDTGNVLKAKGYIYLTHPHLADGTNATIGTTATSITYGHATFSNSVDKATNYVEYYLQVPEDLDTGVALRARIKVLLGNTDTGSQRYVLSSVSVADSAVPGSATLANDINVDFAGDGSGASGDVETSAWTTLTSWAGALTAGQTWRIRFARDGDTSDTSTVNSTELGLVIEYGVTQ